MSQLPIWPPACQHPKPVVSVQRNGEVIRFCPKCGRRL